MEEKKIRYAVVGTGERASLYIDALIGRYRENCELVALCDLSRTRMAWHNKRIVETSGGAGLPAFLAEEFDQMVGATKPDIIIVTTVDSTHHEYIIRAMELGCDVISEKPVTTDEKKAAEILEAIRRTGKELKVTFNYRYSKVASKVRELIRDGVVGKPKHISFNWILDTSHGADYFRRWHRDREFSGGLLVHKAAHHFDLISWWIDSQPSEVFAMGDLSFYGEENAASRGESYDYDSYTRCADKTDDPFAISLADDERLNGLYLDAEQESGYVRDQNVFGKGVTIEDTLSVTARYHSGASLTYSLLAYSPREGCQIAITGDKGRIELDLEGRFSNTLVRCKSDAQSTTTIRIFPMFGEPREIEVTHPTGGHGGADLEMCEQLFARNPKPDNLGREANYQDGINSLLTGVAANHSIKTGKLIQICDLAPK